VKERFPTARSKALPDADRVARCARVPELGPKLLFLTGGTAMRPLTRVVKSYTHNTVHLITPFDSGGSSAKLRDAFDMLSVGDVRNRLLALADETARGNPEIHELLANRLDVAASQEDLIAELQGMIAGDHPLVAAILEPTRHLIRNHLEWFRERMPAAFDLRGASIGNLVLAGGYLENDRDVVAVISLVARLVRARGVVRPITEASLHLEAELADGSRVVGQHRITGKEHQPLGQRIVDLGLVGPKGSEQVNLGANDSVLDLIREADLICFPLGSFWTSIVANLLPAGVGTAIAEARAPKVFVPNAGEDPEQFGMKIHDCVEVLHRKVCDDVGEDVSLARVLDVVLCDSVGADYGDRLDLDRLAALGVEVLDLPLVTERSETMLDPKPLAEVLLTLA